MDFEDRYRKWSSCDPAELFSEARVVTYVPEDKQDIKKNLEQAARSADTYVLTGYAYAPEAQGSLPVGPTHCTCAVRVPASGVPNVPRTVWCPTGGARLLRSDPLARLRPRGRGHRLRGDRRVPRGQPAPAHPARALLRAHPA